MSRIRATTPAAILLPILVALVACGSEGAPRSVESLPLHAYAGADRALRLGENVVLEGASSPTEAPHFLWEVRGRPAGSSSTIEDATQAAARFAPDVEGTYELQLVVRDGKRSGSDDLRLVVGPNAPPVASAGSGRRVAIGTEVELDGRASTDPDGQPLSFEWTVFSLPGASSAALHDATSRTPRFLADEPGRYEFELRVSDGVHEASARVVVEAGQLPVADAGGDIEGRVGEALVLDGSRSATAQGGALAFDWALLGRPPGSTADLADAGTAHARFVPDVAGSYLVELTVVDEAFRSSDRATIVVLPASGFPGSVLFVSPEGDDGSTGLADAPLATVSAALARIRANPAIERIELAAGTYEMEPFDFQSGALEIVGPPDETAPATLVGSDRLFELAGTARLALHRIGLRSDGTAIDARGRETFVSLAGVRCEARRCVESGRFLSTSGGTVVVRDSHLVARAADAIGLSNTGGRQLTVADSRITGFATGISVLSSPLLLRDSVVSENGTGLQISLLQEGSALIEGCEFTGNAVAVTAVQARNTTLRDTAIGEGGRAVEVIGSAVRLDSLSIAAIDGAGIVVGEGALAGDEVVVLRNSVFSSIAGPSVSIKGGSSQVDLGNHRDGGGNTLRSSHVPLDDTRPPQATGIVTLAGTTLDGIEPAAGERVGPYLADGIRIQSAGNRVIAY